MKKLLIAALITTSFSANAGLDIQNFGDFSKADAKLIVGIGSRHFESNDHKYLNESNPSIGVELWDLQLIYVAKNSWNKKSIYLVYAPDYKINDYFSVSANLGIATGYKCSNSAGDSGYTLEPENCSSSGIVPLPAVTLDYSPMANNFALSVSITPIVAMFSLSYKL